MKNIFEAAHGEVIGGRVVKTQVKHIDQSKMTSDCWMIQMWGISACETCEFKGTEDCGGVDIIAKIKARTFPPNGLPNESEE